MNNGTKTSPLKFLPQQSQLPGRKYQLSTTSSAPGEDHPYLDPLVSFPHITAQGMDMFLEMSQQFLLSWQSKDKEKAKSRVRLLI